MVMDLNWQQRWAGYDGVKMMTGLLGFWAVILSSSYGATTKDAVMAGQVCDGGKLAKQQRRV